MFRIRVVAVVASAGVVLASLVAVAPAEAAVAPVKTVAAFKAAVAASESKAVSTGVVSTGSAQVTQTVFLNNAVFPDNEIVLGGKYSDGRMHYRSVRYADLPANLAFLGNLVGATDAYQQQPLKVGDFLPMYVGGNGSRMTSVSVVNTAPNKFRVAVKGDNHLEYSGSQLLYDASTVDYTLANGLVTRVDLVHSSSATANMKKPSTTKLFFAFDYTAKTVAARFASELNSWYADHFSRTDQAANGGVSSYDTVKALVAAFNASSVASKTSGLTISTRYPSRSWSGEDNGPTGTETVVYKPSQGYSVTSAQEDGKTDPRDVLDVVFRSDRYEMAYVFDIVMKASALKQTTVTASSVADAGTAYSIVAQGNSEQGYVVVHNGLVAVAEESTPKASIVWSTSTLTYAPSAAWDFYFGLSESSRKLVCFLRRYNPTAGYLTLTRVGSMLNVQYKTENHVYKAFNLAGMSEADIAAAEAASEVTF
jgi:hypothetical protein